MSGGNTVATPGNGGAPGPTSTTVNPGAWGRSIHVSPWGIVVITGPDDKKTKEEG
jgi:hypothetical protein